MIKALMWSIASALFLTTGLFAGEYIQNYFSVLAALCVVEGMKIGTTLLDKEVKND